MNNYYSKYIIYDKYNQSLYIVDRIYIINHNYENNNILTNNKKILICKSLYTPNSDECMPFFLMIFHSILKDKTKEIIKYESNKPCGFHHTNYDIDRIYDIINNKIYENCYLNNININFYKKKIINQTNINKCKFNIMCHAALLGGIECCNFFHSEKENIIIQKKRKDMTISDLLNKSINCFNRWCIQSMTGKCTFIHTKNDIIRMKTFCRENNHKYGQLFDTRYNIDNFLYQINRIKNQENQENQENHENQENQ